MRELDWQVSSMEQVCTSCLPPLLNLEHLYIYENPRWRQHWQDNIENALWLELLRPFTSVKNLFLSKDFARRIVPLARARWGQSDRSVAHPTEYFLGGTAIIGTGPGGHSTGCCRATGCQSPYSSFLRTVRST